MPERASVYIWRENIIRSSSLMLSRPNSLPSTSPASAGGGFAGAITTGVIPALSSQSATLAAEAASSVPVTVFWDLSRPWYAKLITIDC